MKLSPSQSAKRAMALTYSFDVATAAIAMAVALSMRWLTTGHLPPSFGVLILVATATFAASAALSFYLMRIHRQVWRHMDSSDAVRVLQAVGLAALIFLPSVFAWNRLVGLPRSAVVLALILWVLALFAGRMFALSRTTRHPFQVFQKVHKDAPKAVLLGDSETAAEVISNLRQANGGAKIRLLGIVQTDGAQPGRAIRGVPVLGAGNDLEFVLQLLQKRYGEVPWVAVTGDARRPAVMTRTLEIVARLKTKLMALSSRAQSPDLKEVRPSDLLARAVRSLDSRPVEALVNGASVLVTGGGGSIGLELARQCAALGPRRLALVDSCEYNLYRADMLLAREFPDLECDAILGNIRDRHLLGQIFSGYKPDLVIHAAALKHVPLMEEHVCEAILTNVEGAMNVANACVEHDAGQLVFISTDKAVDPDNVMGATKRIAELITMRIARTGGVTPAIVRFGNVLGSSGSVVPLFNEQIETGGPVTVTHPEATRYFMTIEEAAALVLQAGAQSATRPRGGMYLLDMGEPIRIEQLAESMIRMRGLVPGVDIDIEYTGLRPGEKLCEKLTHEYENLEPTGIEGVLQVRGESETGEGFELVLKSLLRAAGRRERVEALTLLGKLVPHYAARAAERLSDVAGA